MSLTLGPEFDDDQGLHLLSTPDALTASLKKIIYFVVISP